jgi:hypothetical protein
MLSPSLILPVLVLGLLPARAAAQETAGTCVNGPKTRSCWQRGFDIHTDYTALQAPAGKIVEVGGHPPTRNRFTGHVC